MRVSWVEGGAHDSFRLSFRVESPSPFWLVRPRNRSRFDNDSLAYAGCEMKRRTNLTSSLLERTVASLGDRDRMVIETVAKFRYATTVQLQRLFFADGPRDSNARRARLSLRRLAELRVLLRLERRVGGVRAGSAGQVYSVDLAGQYLLAVNGLTTRRRPLEPSHSFVRHSLAVTELFVLLTEAERSGLLKILEFEPEPPCWRPFVGPSGARGTLKPDAFVVVGSDHEDDPELWFVEVDRATESSTALKNKFRTYRQYWTTGIEQAKWENVFPRVLWLAPDARRIRTLIDVATSEPAEVWKLHTIRPYSEALLVLTPEGETS